MNITPKPRLQTPARILILAALAALVLSACSPAPEPPATPTPTPTLPPPTATLQPSPTAEPSITPTVTPVVTQPEFPIRAALYRPYTKDDWIRTGLVPILGDYASSDKRILEQQIKEMKYAGITVGLAYWNGPESDEIFQVMLDTAARQDFIWAVVLEQEKTDDPFSSEIQAWIDHIQTAFASHPAYFRLDGRFVVFTDVEENEDSCGMASRWRDGNRSQAYLVMQSFEGYTSCSGQPDLWMDLTPATPASPAVLDSFAITAPVVPSADLFILRRTLENWVRDVRSMSSSVAKLHIVVSYNDWLHNTGIEPLVQRSSSGKFYLDILHDNGASGEDRVQQVLKGEKAILIGAGDAAVCDSAGTAATTSLLSEQPGAVFIAGNAAGPQGTTDNYTNCFEPTWGQFLERIYPAPGSGDYVQPNASAYFSTFGRQAGQTGQGWYSFELGAWHIVVLNSVCAQAGCAEDSEQVEWLKADLAASPSKCTLAIWQAPYYSSGREGRARDVKPFWDALYAAGADVVINGRDNFYERFAPLDPAGVKNEENGIRQFTVGTGGAGLKTFAGPAANSEVRIQNVFGLLKLTLDKDSYTWEFLPQAGLLAADSGSAACH